MARRIISSKKDSTDLLDDKEIKIFKSWHPKIQLGEITETWQEGKIKYIKLKDETIIGIPFFSKQEWATPGRYKGRTQEILSSSLGR